MQLMEDSVEHELPSLTCLELWLENIFQSVPESGVCFHRDGFVQARPPPRPILSGFPRRKLKRKEKKRVRASEARGAHRVGVETSPCACKVK